MKDELEDKDNAVALSDDYVSIRQAAGDTGLPIAAIRQAVSHGKVASEPHRHGLRVKLSDVEVLARRQQPVTQALAPVRTRTRRSISYRTSLHERLTALLASKGEQSASGLHRLLLAEREISYQSVVSTLQSMAVAGKIIQRRDNKRVLNSLADGVPVPPTHQTHGA